MSLAWHRRLFTTMTISAYLAWGIITWSLYLALCDGTATWFRAIMWGVNGWLAEYSLYQGADIIRGLRALEKLERDLLDKHRKD